jgi:hypothetical protein
MRAPIAHLKRFSIGSQTDKNNGSLASESAVEKKMVYRITAEGRAQRLRCRARDHPVPYNRETVDWRRAAGA